MNLLYRVKSAMARIGWATQFTHNPLYTLYYLLSYKLDKTQLARGTHKGTPFYFRSTDIEALKEVLIDMEYSVLSDFIKRKNAPVVLDLGHHIGTFALWCFSQNKNSTLLGVEAGPDTYNIALKNSQLGQSLGFKWSVINRAAWKNNDTITFSCEGNTLGHRVNDNGNISVQGISFPELIKLADKKVDLLKIDIEGAEEMFLTAYPNCLDNIEAMVIEIHPNYCSEEAVMQLIKAKFSKITPIQQRIDSKPLLWCTKD